MVIEEHKTQFLYLQNLKYVIKGDLIFNMFSWSFHGIVTFSKQK